MNKYLVGTGAVLFTIEASDPREAIAILKARIDARRDEPVQNPLIGMSLVNALDEHRLSFIVMDTERTQLLGGELNWFDDGGTRMSRYEDVVTRKLVNALPLIMTEHLYYQTDHTTA